MSRTIKDNPQRRKDVHLNRKIPVPYESMAGLREDIERGVRYFWTRPHRRKLHEAQVALGQLRG